MGIYDEYLRNIANEINNASSAQQISRLNDAMVEVEKQRKFEELNSPTNQHLRKIIEQSNLIIRQCDEQNQILKEQNDNLKEQLKYAVENEKEAKKDAKHSRMWVYISTGIAFASLIATIIIAIVK